MNVCNNTCALQDNAQDWNTIQWRTIIEHVSRLQRRIAKAIEEKRWGKVKSLIFLLSKSFHAKLLAVFRVTSNKGRFTAGVDGQTWLTAEEKKCLSRMLGMTLPTQTQKKQTRVSKLARTVLRGLTLPG